MVQTRVEDSALPRLNRGGAPRGAAVLAALLILSWLVPAHLEATPAPAPIADLFWESALAASEAAKSSAAPPVLAKKLERKQLQAQKRPVPYNQPSEAQRFFLLKRAPAPGLPLPVER